MDYSKLRELRERDGDARFTRFVVNELIAKGELNASNLSLRGLWEACGRPDLARGKRLLGREISEAEFTEQMDSSAFPKITGALINKTVIDAYQSAPGIAMDLVRVVPSSQRDDTVVGFGAADIPEEVLEGGPYQEGAITEKYVKVRNRKWGRLISLTDEMVKFDQTGLVVQAAQRLGDQARSKQEEIIMEAVLGYVNTGEYAAWRPAATPTTLYSDTSTDPQDSLSYDNVNTNKLADETDIDENVALLGAALDEKSRPIAINPTDIVTGPAYINVARRICQSSIAVKLTSPSGIINTYSYLTPRVSPYVATKMGSAYWLIGDFKKQFVYSEVFPLQVFQAKPGSEDEWKRDIVMGFKVRFMGGAAATSNRYVVRSTGAD